MADQHIVPQTKQRGKKSTEFFRLHAYVGTDGMKQLMRDTRHFADYDDAVNRAGRLIRMKVFLQHQNREDLIPF